MYAQLGNIRFEGLKGFSSLKETFGVNYAQHDRINGKPRLQAVGDVLDSISFEMFLHADFTDPETDIDALRKYMQDREVLPLILGNGRVLGNFVIPTLEKTTEFTDPSGNLISATLSVELLEVFNENPIREAQLQAINAAFATSVRSSNIRSINPAKLSQGMSVSKNVAKIQTSGTLINQYTAAAESNPSTMDFYSGKISDTLTTIETTVQDTQNQLTAAQNLQDLATSLPGALSDVNTRVQNMIAILPITNISDFKVLNYQLQGSILAAKTANVGINNQSIIRRI